MHVAFTSVLVIFYIFSASVYFVLFLFFWSYLSLYNRFLSNCYNFFRSLFENKRNSLNSMEGKTCAVVDFWMVVEVIGGCWGRQLPNRSRWSRLRKDAGRCALVSKEISIYSWSAGKSVNSHGKHKRSPSLLFIVIQIFCYFVCSENVVINI